jgi:SAM-dependent methyltransferase
LSADPVLDPTRRFSDRVDYYVRHRPDYPVGLLDLLRREADLRPGKRIADVGSGTGRSTEPFLRAGHLVYAVEPNREMRAAAERALGSLPGFRSVDGTAESTGLPPACVDLVVAAQAFHWFRADAARREFRRILAPGGRIALLWNRRVEASPFLRAYEALLRRLSLDYAAVDHRRTTDSGAVERFFGTSGCRRATLPHEQVLDWPGLEGRALSASYVPLPGQPRHEEMMRGLRALFDAHARAGRVRIEYETEVYCGRAPEGDADGA